MEFSVEETAIVHLMMDYFRQKQAYETLSALILESNVKEIGLDDNLFYLQRLVLQGRWDDIAKYIEPINDLFPDSKKDISFIVSKQKYLETLSWQGGGGSRFAYPAYKPLSQTIIEDDKANDLENILLQLNALKELCSSQEFNSLCTCLTLDRLDDHPNYKNWTVSQGRYECFFELNKILHIKIKSNNYNYNNNSHYNDQVDYKKVVEEQGGLLRTVAMGLAYQHVIMKQANPNNNSPLKSKENINSSYFDERVRYIVPSIAVTASINQQNIIRPLIKTPTLFLVTEINYLKRFDQIKNNIENNIKINKKDQKNYLNNNNLFEYENKIKDEYEPLPSNVFNFSGKQSILGINSSNDNKIIHSNNYKDDNNNNKLSVNEIRPITPQEINLKSNQPKLPKEAAISWVVPMEEKSAKIANNKQNNNDNNKQNNIRNDNKIDDKELIGLSFPSKQQVSDLLPPSLRKKLEQNHNNSPMVNNNIDQKSEKIEIKNDINDKNNIKPPPRISSLPNNNNNLKIDNILVNNNNQIDNKNDIEYVNSFKNESSKHYNVDNNVNSDNYYIQNIDIIPINRQQIPIINKQNTIITNKIENIDIIPTIIDDNYQTMINQLLSPPINLIIPKSPIKNKPFSPSSTPRFRPFILFQTNAPLRCASFLSNNDNNNNSVLHSYQVAVGSNSKSVHILNYNRTDIINKSKMISNLNNNNDNNNNVEFSSPRRKHSNVDGIKKERIYYDSIELIKNNSIDMENVHKGSIYSMDWDDNSRILVTGSNDKDLRVLKPDRCEISGPLKGHKGIIRIVKFRNGSTHHQSVFASGGAGDCKPRIWDVASESCINSFSPHPDAIHSLLWFNENILLSLSEKGNLIGNDIRTLQPIINYNINNNIQNSNYQKSNLLLSNNNNNNNLNTYSMSILQSSSLDQQLIVGCSNGCLIQCNIMSGDITSLQKTHNDDIRALSVLDYNSNNHLLTGSYDNNACFWNHNKLNNEVESISLLDGVHVDKILSVITIPTTQNNNTFDIITTGADGKVVLWMMH
eukprot:gene6228-8583_t